MIINTAERIKELRLKNNMTQTELAKRLYITRSSVNAWEMATSIPSTEKITESPGAKRRRIHSFGPLYPG